MDKLRIQRNGRVWRLGMLLAALLLRGLAAGADQTFDLLQIGTHTYTNVTVTTKAKSYIFILHSAGMANIRVSELSPELLEQLGYIEHPAPRHVVTNNAVNWVKQYIFKFEVPPKQQLEQTWRSYFPNGRPSLRSLSPNIIGVLIGCYLFFSYCCKLICQKAGKKVGFMVWFPGRQIPVLLKAAGMSRFWSLAYILLVPAVIAHVVWSVRIAKARGKSFWVAILLLFPPTIPFAFLYLAFSNGVAKEVSNAPEILSLETA